jgi:hypothetical protein
VDAYAILEPAVGVRKWAAGLGVPTRKSLLLLQLNASSLEETMEGQAGWALIVD